MTMTNVSSEVREYGTRLLRTRISTTDDGHLWQRTPGQAAPEPFAPAVDLPSLSSTGVQVVVGRPDGESRRYRVPGAHAVAGLLLENHRQTDFVPHLRGLGRTLRTLHDLEDVPGTEHLTVPRAVRRLTAWIDGDAPVLGAQVSRSRLRSLLGPERWERVDGWLAAATAQDTVLSHGAASLGSLTIDTVDGVPALLTGEDLGLAPRGYDVGWVLGELVELAWQMAWPPAVQQRLFSAVVEGYGSQIDASVRRWMVLRILLHMHDFSAYTDGWNPVLPHYSQFVNHLIDSQTGETS